MGLRGEHPNPCPNGADSLAEDNMREVKSDFSFVDKNAVLRVQGRQLDLCFNELSLMRETEKA